MRKMELVLGSFDFDFWDQIFFSYKCLMILKKKKRIKGVWVYGSGNGFNFYTQYRTRILDGLKKFYPSRPDYPTQTEFWCLGRVRLVRFAGLPKPMSTPNSC